MLGTGVTPGSGGEVKTLCWLIIKHKIFMTVTMTVFVIQNLTGFHLRVDVAGVGRLDRLEDYVR